MLKSPTGLTFLLKDAGRVSGTMVRACSWPTTAAKGQGRTRVCTRAQASVSNGLELASITFPSEPERKFGSLPHCLRSRGVMVVMMVVVMLLMMAIVTGSHHWGR